MKKRLLSLFLAFAMIFSMLPATALAADGEDLGQVRVIVENTTYTVDEGAPWDGTLVDTQVDLTEESTMMSCVATALKDQTVTGIENNYISDINGVGEFGSGSGGGWMGTLNDWFVDTGFDTVTDLMNGDIIRVMYTCDMGTDIGGGWATRSNTSLSALSVVGGSLDAEFDSAIFAYDVTLGEGVEELTINATASNKQNQVYLFVGETEYRRTASIPVEDDTLITVRCGDGDGATTYTLTVAQESTEPEVPEVTTYTVTLPEGEGYTVTATEGSVSPVNENGSYSFTVEITEGYEAGEGFAVKANDEALEAGEDGVYTIENITANQVITVEGVVAAEEEEEEPVPFSEQISLPSNGDSSWGYVSKLVLSGTDGGIYEAYWSSESSPFVLDVILTQDTDLDAQITAAFSTAGLRKPSISGETTVALQAGKGTIHVTAVSGISAFYPNTVWTINLTVDDGSAANRPTYTVALPTETVGYRVAASGSSASPVIEGRKFSFTVTIDNAYKAGENFAVKANGEVLTASNGVYTIENISENKVITVEGVVEKTLAELNVTIIAPAGSTISSGRFYSYFKYDFNEPLEKNTLEDGRLSYVFPVPASQGFLRVQHPDGVTYWDFDNLKAGSVFEITEEMLFIGSSEFTKETVYADFEKNVKDKADLYLTANEKGWLDLKVGDTWNLNVFRNFLSLGNSISNSHVALPDVEYTVIPVNGATGVVSVTPDANNSSYAEIKAEKDGTAIILVTYDAVYNNDGEGGKQWSAIWPENTGVIVVTVGAEEADIQTNMTVNEEANAGGKQVIDAEHDILFYVGSSGASYSFKPEDGCTVTVNRSSIQDGVLGFNGFTSTGVSVAQDGTVTVSGLTTGSHIIKVEKDGEAAYQVIRARKVSYELKHSDGTAVSAGSPAQPGETITVQFHELISPLEKLSGVYNANFGFYYNGDGGLEIRTSGGGYGVYTFSGTPSLQKFTVTVPSYWNENTLTLTDGGIKLGGFGGSFGAHRTTTYITGKEVNTNASGTGGVASVLPDIVIPTDPTGINVYWVTLPQGEGYTVTGGKTPITEGDSYTFSVTVKGGYDGNGMVVKVNGQAVTLTDSSYTVESVTEDLTITVEGVVKVNVEAPAETTVVYTNGVDGSNWTDSNVYVDTVAIGGEGVAVAQYSWEGNVCTITLAEDTPVNANVVFTMTIGGKYTNWFNSAALNGTSMSPELPCSVTLIDGTAVAELSVTARSKTAAKTFIFTGAQGEALKPAPTWQEVLERTQTYLTAQAKETAPIVGANNGEWLAIGLARAESDTSDWAEAYYAEVGTQNITNNQLHSVKSTENARVILALTALGYDPADVNGSNLLAGFTDMTYVSKQGVNGPIWALIALDSKDYDEPNTNVTRDALIDAILAAQLNDGGWALNSQGDDPADPDMTGMALTALAPYYSTHNSVKAAVDKALDCLSNKQNADGGFTSSGDATAESCAQVIVALSALGIDADNDERFIKNGKSVLDALLAYHVDGGFEHVANGGKNTMTTEQGFYALVAYNRFVNGKPALYDMSDVAAREETEQQPATAEAVKTAMEALEVKKADKKTYDAIQAILEEYSKLTREEKAAIAETYEDFLDKEEDFEDLLDDAIDDAQLDLEDLYSELDSEDYSEENWDEIRALYRAYRDLLKDARYTEELADILEEFEEEIDCIQTGSMEVTFRLIGDFKHDDGVDGHEEYVTWVETTQYYLAEGSTVYDLLLEALEDAGLSQKGASKNYVESIKAPKVFGGYWLSEFDNGPNSGWMYTINGDHPGEGLKDWELEDGDEVIWHYVDDYTLEERKSSSKYYERWLEADDISPETYIKRHLEDIVTIEGEGKVTPTLKSSHIGKDVSFTFEPAEGWIIQAVYVDGKNKGAIERYEYEELSMSSRIEVVFAEADADKWFFIDVPAGEWYYEDVYYAVESGLFNGTGEHTFSPKAPMTRAMLVTVLYRLEGEPAVYGSNAFSDVAEGLWYSDAVLWAARNGIVTGYTNGEFGVNDNITREQMAAILYRYAQYKGYDVTDRDDLSGYADAPAISAYAVEALSWANAEGLVNGRTADTLAPAGTATRAEVAAIFHRFVENIVK